MRRVEGTLPTSLHDRATRRAWTRWLTFAVILFGLTLRIEAAANAGKIRIDLAVENPGDSTSAVVSWPKREDLATDPRDTAVEEVVWRAFETASGTIADPSTADSLPRLGQSAEDFVEHLKGLLTTRGFVFADGFDIFTDALPPKIRFGFDWTSYTADVPAPILPTCFEVWVRTDLLPAASPALRRPIRQLADDPAVQSMLQAQRGEKRSPSSGQRIPENFILVILPAEGPWLRSVSADQAADGRFTPLFAVAVACADEALRQKALEKSRTPANRDQLAAALAHSFDEWRMTGEIGFGNELSAVDDAYNQPAAPAWVMRLTGFNPVRRQTVSVGEIQLGNEGRQPWAVFQAHQQEEGHSLAALIAQKTALEEKLSRLLEKEHPWGAPHFPNKSELAARSTFLRRQSGVAGVEPKIFRDEVAYSIVWYPLLTTFEAAGTYNSDRGGNVSGRLAVQSRDFGLGVEGFIANRRRGLFADISTTPKATSLPDNATTTWGLFGDYSKESPVRFGSPEAFILDDEEAKGGLRWRIEGGHADDTAAISARRWKIDVSAGYRHARLTGENFGFATTPDGEAPFASTEFVGEWDHGRKNAPGEIQPATGMFHVELSVDASPASGALAHFARGQFKATEEFQFNAGRLENSLVRLTLSGGSATPATPLAWWFRLGGDERMRGFELGELTGRSFLHAGIEAGIGIGTFLRKPAGNASPTPAPGFDFRQIRVLAGVEHAWLGETPLFVPSVKTLRDGWSYSLTAEYGGPIPGLPGSSKLAIGYGYAPESSHRSGRIFVTLRVPLSLPQPP